ncbi:YajQ family cyclic di-GMP-binding protein [Immundisolibacter sp.]|uniref:YajQ family cyclic di-GMP-binding protein n=1 Tax=Immundisolibacter sp. TaxID=1934948 RepID=UPI0026111C4A|nr:YajQ family cyclic di-GMP-binding protein [Immundisolibacter sp.]MDD3649946.1 YajQ family cyclic di-GMP-binding protein [Immundisolibacter sp.]
MPSFDVVSKADLHEVANAVDQTNRELGTRFDFKDTGAKVELNEAVITAQAPSRFQIEQLLDVLRTRLAKRGVDLKALDYGKVVEAGQRATQTITVRQGIDAEHARKLVKLIKDSKLKVQAAIQGDELRVSGKSRDDLQAAIALLRKLEDFDLPLQFVNFRD